MDTRLIGQLAAGLLASFLLHAVLLLNSVQAELDNQLNRQGQAMARQLAEALLSPVLAGDQVTAGLILERLIRQDAVASAAVHSVDGRLTAHAGDLQSPGQHLQQADIRLPQQRLATVRLGLRATGISELLPRAAGNLALSFGLHGLMLAGVTFALRPRREEDLPPRRKAAPPQPPISVLSLLLDDPNDLLGRLNGSSRDELVRSYLRLIQQAATNYDGELEGDLAANTLRATFRQRTDEARQFSALCAAALGQCLLTDMLQARRQQGLIALPVRMGIYHAGPDSHPVTRRACADALARMAPPSLILSSQTGLLPRLLGRCQVTQTVNVACPGHETGLSSAVLNGLTPEYQAVIEEQAERLLGRETTANQ